MSQRRSPGEGSIYQREDGTWTASIELGFINGKRRRKVIYGKTRKDVVEKLRAAKRQQEQGVNLAHKRQTVQQYLTQWLEDTAQYRTQPITFKRYSELIRLHINPHIGHLSLEKLGPEHVQRMLNTLHNNGLAPRTVHHVRAVLRTALNAALRFGYVSRNAAILVDGPKVKRHQVEPLTEEQACRLLNAVSGHRLEALYRVALGLGLRRGEIIALRWSDVNFEQRTLRVRKSKTDAGVRSLTLPVSLIDALRAHWSFQLQERLAQGLNWKEHNLIFPSERGTPLSGRNLVRHFKRALERAGLSTRIRFHDLRHSCASFLLAQNVHPRVVMEILGHSQVSITLDTYSHVLPDTQRDALSKLDDLFNGKDNDKDDEDDEDDDEAMAREEAS